MNWIKKLEFSFKFPRFTKLLDRNEIWAHKYEKVTHFDKIHSVLVFHHSARERRSHNDRLFLRKTLIDVYTEATKTKFVWGVAESIRLKREGEKCIDFEMLIIWTLDYAMYLFGTDFILFNFVHFIFFLIFSLSILFFLLFISQYLYTKTKSIFLFNVIDSEPVWRWLIHRMQRWLGSFSSTLSKQSVLSWSQKNSAKNIRGGALVRWKVFVSELIYETTRNSRLSELRNPKIQMQNIQKSIRHNKWWDVTQEIHRTF